jgi:hypothetical protein
MNLALTNTHFSIQAAASDRDLSTALSSTDVFRAFSLSCVLIKLTQPGSQGPWEKAS